MEVQMFTLVCANPDCMLRLRIGRFLRLPRIGNNKLQYCPACSHKTSFTFEDSEEDYWESLSKAYELPVEAVMSIYSIWNAKENPSFREFVDELKKESLELVGK